LAKETGKTGEGGESLDGKEAIKEGLYFVNRKEKKYSHPKGKENRVHRNRRDPFC